jgi:hypothetical protein
MGESQRSKCQPKEYYGEFIFRRKRKERKEI